MTVLTGHGRHMASLASLQALVASLMDALETGTTGWGDGVTEAMEPAFPTRSPLFHSVQCIMTAAGSTRFVLPSLVIGHLDSELCAVCLWEAVDSHFSTVQLLATNGLRGAAILQPSRGTLAFLSSKIFEGVSGD